jgi:acetyl-CoA carboxylase carboxyltransferase component
MSYKKPRQECDASAIEQSVGWYSLASGAASARSCPVLSSVCDAIGQAGQVWFPDSALKTAHAMEEFDREGLPLFVLANWRGFSGGQRDLFEGVLQARPPASPK